MDLFKMLLLQMIDSEVQSEKIRREVQHKIKRKTRKVADRAGANQELREFMMEQADLLGL